MEEPSVFPLEAALLAGTVVRLHLRSVIEASGNDDRRWLVCFEDFALQKVQLQTEAILNAEIFGLLDSIDYGVLLLDAAGENPILNDRLSPIMGGRARRP